LRDLRFEGLPGHARRPWRLRGVHPDHRRRVPPPLMALSRRPAGPPAEQPASEQNQNREET
jgi:hypothetical protein